MRTWLVMLMVVALSAAPAQAAELRLKRLALSGAPPVASAGSGGLAYLVSPTALRVRRSSKPSRTYAVASGCRPAAMATGVVALTCVAEGAHAVVIAVLREADGSIVAVAQLGGRRYWGATAIGKHWLHTSGDQIGDDDPSSTGGRGLSRNFLVEWHTGRVIELESDLGPTPDPLGPEEYADLDARDPVRRLCAPLIRGPYTHPNHVQRVGRWVAQPDDQGWALQRCGRSRVLRSDHWTGAVLGRDAFAYLFRRRIVLRDLRSETRLSAAWPNEGRRPQLAMYGRRLVVFDSDSTGLGTYRIYVGPRDF